MREIEEKLRNPKQVKVVSLRTSYIKLEEDFDELLKEVEYIVITNRTFYKSYDISKSIDDISMCPIIHIILYP